MEPCGTLCLILDHIESIVLLYLCLLILFDICYLDNVCIVFFLYQVYHINNCILDSNISFTQLKCFFISQKIIPTVKLLFIAYKSTLVNL